MGTGDDGSGLGETGLEDHQRFAELAGAQRRPGEPGRVGEGFQVEADGGDPVVVDHRLDHILDPHPGLVPEGDDHRQREAPPLHGHVDRQVPRLGDDRHTPIHPPAPLDVRPQHRPGQGVDVPVAVGPDQRHVARRLHQPSLEFGPLFAGLGKPGGITHHPATPHLSQRRHHLDGANPVDGDKGGVGSAGEVCDGGEGRVPGQLGPTRVDRPDRPGEAEYLGLLDGIGRSLTTDEGHRLGVEQAVHSPTEAAEHRPADDVTLDLGGAVPDPFHPGVTPHALEG